MSAHSDVLVPPELAGAVDGLVAEFTGVFAREAIGDCVLDSYRRLRPARVEAYLPLLAYRFARERLRAAAVSKGLLPHAVPEVLFVCTRNAARSQLAAAVLTHEAGGRVVVRSAGTAPVPAVQPEVLTALAEVGIDAGGAYPKPLTEESVAAADVVVTMGCGDSCPVLPGRRYLDWDLPDPDGAPPEVVRAVRDDITVRVRVLLAELDTVDAPVEVRAFDVALLRLLADPLRARIVQLLAAEELCTCHLVELTGAKQTNISNHLRALREAGLVQQEPCGRFTYYRLDPDALEALGGALSALAAAARSAPERRRPC